MTESGFHLKHHLTSFQIMILGFAGVILLGALVLMLPIATASHTWTPFHEALFTSTSAVCVTGLVVQDTGSYWSGFGQTVILLLIQIGGLGVITAAVTFLMLSGRNISLKERSAMQDAISAPVVGGIVRLTRFILKGTFLVELVGALALLPVFCRDYGLRGVFADSLPDAWGQLLVDRMLKARGILSADMTQLERLAIVGDSGMGALAYRPAWNIQQDAAIDDLDELSAQCHAILNHEDAGDLDELFQMGGSSGGARPKIMTDEWIIKFPASDEMKDSGTMEKAYMDCAADCGIIVPETKLMPSSVCAGYFAVKRFDRRKTDGHIEQQHMLTAAAILEVDWRTAAMDYHTLMKLTKILSLDNREDLEQMYRRMCFNVFAHNRDDHAKNFSWIYDEQMDCWHPSPAYDLTWSTTYFGEHSTTVDGNGRNPGMKELLAVGKAAGMNAKNCKMIAEEIWEKTRTLEATYRGWKS